MLTSFPSSETINPIDCQVTIHSDLTGTIRSYLNGALCVESPFDTETQKKTVVSKTELNGIKRISCSCSNTTTCQTHKDVIKTKPCKSNAVKMVAIKRYYSNSCSEDKIEKPTTDIEEEEEEEEEKEKERPIQKCMLRKLTEKTSIEESKISLVEKSKTDEQKRLEKEQDNFKRWLAKKKEKEIMEEQEKEKRMQNAKEKEVDKERRQIESTLRFQLWLKRKEQAELERKIEEEQIKAKHAEEMKRRTRENQEAYENWLKNSAGKQKPVPTGKGLESLRSCVSIAYINPVPWSSNIENLPVKPSSY